MGTIQTSDISLSWSRAVQELQALPTKVLLLPPVSKQVVDVAKPSNRSTTGWGPCGTCQRRPCPRRPTRSTRASKGIWRGRARVPAPQKGVLVEEHSAVVGHHVDVLRQLTVTDASSFLHTKNHRPRAAEVTCQRCPRLSRPGAGIPGEKLQLVRRPQVPRGEAQVQRERCGDRLRAVW